MITTIQLIQYLLNQWIYYKEKNISNIDVKSQIKHSNVVKSYQSLYKTLIHINEFLKLIIIKNKKKLISINLNLMKCVNN